MNISILGCGWLGLPLAKKLIQKEHVVKGSTTRREKIFPLQQEGIIPYRINLLEEGVLGDLSSFLSDADVLIINIPPGLRNNPDSNFVGKIERLKNYIDKSPVKYVLFVSATSVYEDTPEVPVYTENDTPNGKGENSKQLHTAEQLLKSGETYLCTVVRFGGLIGPGRHPVKSISSKPVNLNPQGPVNLIHLDDCIGIIEKVIEVEAWGETFNAVFPEHPTKKEYYTQKAGERNLPTPKFDHNRPSTGKIIESVHIGEKLKYDFKRKLI